MWMLNLFFFAVIFAALRTGDLWSIIPISAIFMLLHYWLAETEDNGTDYTIQRPSSYDNDNIHWILDDTHSDLDHTKR